MYRQSSVNNNNTRLVHNLFQDLWNKFLGFFQKILKGAKNSANMTAQPKTKLVDKD